MQNSKSYLRKKEFFDKILTIYGRNAVAEAIKDETLSIYRLHISKSNKNAEILEMMKNIAFQRNIEVKYHDKQSLSRISKNARQDQGVALDIIWEHSCNVEHFLEHHDRYRIIALDSISNPQNLGMIIRSCAAGNIDAILLPNKKSAQINPLVIKASAGTLFKIPIIKISSLKEALCMLKTSGAKLYTLSAHAQYSYKEQEYGDKTIFVLGNESEGVSKEVEAICDSAVAIPMKRDVESLNVAVSAALLAFMI